MYIKQIFVKFNNFNINYNYRHEQIYIDIYNIYNIYNNRYYNIILYILNKYLSKLTIKKIVNLKFIQLYFDKFNINYKYNYRHEQICMNRYYNIILYILNKYLPNLIILISIIIIDMNRYV